jgi:outer membrane protein assembly factor BamB
MRQNVIFGLILLVILGCCKEPQQPNTTNSLETIWKTPLSTSTETVSMNPVLYKDLIIYCIYDGSPLKSKLIALNRNTGKLVWEWRYTDFEVGDFTTSQTYIYNNILIMPILGGNNQRVLAINLDDGTRAWQILENGISYEIKGFKDKFYCLRILEGGKKSDIMVGDVYTGNWQPLYSIVSQNAGPAYFDRMTLYDDKNGSKCLAFQVLTDTSFSYRNLKYKIVKFNLDSNKLVYNKELNYLDLKAEYFFNGYMNGKFWLGSIGTYFYAIDELTANEALKILIPTANRTGKMLAQGNKVFITTETKIYCYSENNGMLLWREDEFSGGSPSRLLQHNNFLYFTSAGTGKLHVIDSNTGKNVYSIVSPDKKGNGQGGFDTAITLDTVNKRIYTATYFSAICYQMPK